MSHPKTAAEAVQNQLTVILEAIALLQAKADAIIDTVNPDESNWKDVGKFEAAADAARCVIERLS